MEVSGSSTPGRGPKAELPRKDLLELRANGWAPWIHPSGRVGIRFPEGFCAFLGALGVSSECRTFLRCLAFVFFSFFWEWGVPFKPLEVKNFQQWSFWQGI